MVNRALFAATLLAGCSGVPKLPAADLFALRASYDATVLAPAAGYAQLPACPTADGVCADSGVLAIIQKADAGAAASLDLAESAVRSDPGADPTLLLSAAQRMVEAAAKLLADHGVK
jgi:hypothetical protein